MTMNDILPSLLTGLISGAITAVVTYFATLAKARLDLSIEYDKELRQERLKAYKDLWKRLESLAPYSPKKPLTYQLVKSTSEDLRDWYFEFGGIYLSQECRESYFALKESLQRVIDNPGLMKEKTRTLEPELAGTLRKQGSIQRTALSDDIGSRRRSFREVCQVDQFTSPQFFCSIILQHGS
jgi:hypothetical protein